MKSRVLILGAGFGGLELATLLSEALGEGADITVIDRSDSFVFGYSRIDVMFGKMTLDDVSLPYAAFEKPGIRLVKETIIAIDATAKRVTTDGGTYEADFLVIALGADYDMAATPGLAEHGNEFYSDAGADRLSDVLPGFSSGPVIVGICGFPYKCPPGPSECALTLHHYLTERGIRGDCDITFVSPLSSPMPASAEMAQALMDSFEEFGIRLLKQRMVVRLEPGMAVLDDGTELPFKLFLGVPKHQPPQVVIDSGLTEGWLGSHRPVDAGDVVSGRLRHWGYGRDGIAQIGHIRRKRRSMRIDIHPGKAQGEQRATQHGARHLHRRIRRWPCELCTA